MQEILNAFLDNPLSLFILIIVSGFGIWLGYNGNKLKKKYPIKEQIELKIRGNLINYVFLFLFIVGVLLLVLIVFNIDSSVS